MKRLLSLAAISLALGCLNVKGQGYFEFASGGTKVLWENFTTGGGPIIIAPSTSVNVAFLFGTGTPLIGTSGSPTNAESIGSWSSIFSDPNFHFGTNANTGQLAVASTVNTGPVRGTFVYNSGISFPVAGTTPGATYNVFALGWPSAFATPQIAAASGTIFGWSNTFSYQTGPDSGAAELPFSFSGGMAPFGLVIPEPSALSLAGLGGMSLAFFRRRK